MPRGRPKKDKTEELVDMIMSMTSDQLDSLEEIIANIQSLKKGVKTKTPKKAAKRTPKKKPEEFPNVQGKPNEFVEFMKELSEDPDVVKAAKDDKKLLSGVVRSRETRASSEPINVTCDVCGKEFKMAPDLYYSAASVGSSPVCNKCVGKTRTSRT